MKALREKLNTTKVFTQLDHKNRYHLVGMAEEDKEKIVFRTSFVLYYSRVMPFRLCNAPATCQSMMGNIFYDLLDNSVIVYLNDILIYTESVDTPIPLVQEVLS